MADELPSCLTLHGERLWLAVSVVPNAKRTGVDGLHDGALRVRLASPPVDGKANDTLVAWLAAELGLARRHVTLVRGQTARRKWLELDGSADDIVGAVTRLLTTGAARA
ncbi:DUF167 domain-containing protein [Variovorax sp. YR752]|uniref:DUF167 domain-containing protein n=1 Tax=Variovorax sp. YR752 TaxID=1884383 RepID=UPI0031380CA7